MVKTKKEVGETSDMSGVERWAFGDVAKRCGITKKGEPMAKQIWELLPDLFALRDVHTTPWEFHDMVVRLSREYAARAALRERGK